MPKVTIYVVGAPPIDAEMDRETLDALLAKLNNAVGNDRARIKLASTDRESLEREEHSVRSGLIADVVTRDEPPVADAPADESENQPPPEGDAPAADAVNPETGETDAQEQAADAAVQAEAEAADAAVAPGAPPAAKAKSGK